jgi:hypothetical protein
MVRRRVGESPSMQINNRFTARNIWCAWDGGPSEKELDRFRAPRQAARPELPVGRAAVHF